MVLLDDMVVLAGIHRGVMLSHGCKGVPQKTRDRSILPTWKKCLPWPAHPACCLPMCVLPCSLEPLSSYQPLGVFSFQFAILAHFHCLEGTVQISYLFRVFFEVFDKQGVSTSCLQHSHE